MQGGERNNHIVLHVVVDPHINIGTALTDTTRMMSKHEVSQRIELATAQPPDLESLLVKLGHGFNPDIVLTTAYPNSEHQAFLFLAGGWPNLPVIVGGRSFPSVGKGRNACTTHPVPRKPNRCGHPWGQRYRYMTRTSVPLRFLRSVQIGLAV
jgi:hypothetical protein